MSAVPLTDDDHRETLRLLSEHGTQRAAAIACGMNRSTFESRVRTARVWEQTQDAGTSAPSTPPPPVEPAPPEYSAYEEAWAVWQRRLDIARSRYDGPSTRTVPDGRQKVLILPDLHAPYHHAQMLADVIAAERDADICILMGDVSDSYALSRYEKTHRAHIEDEIAAVVAILETLSATFPDVRLIRGNHDARLERQLTARLNDIEFVLAIKWMTGGTLDFVEAAARRFDNVRVCGVEASDGQRADWMMVLGDVVLLHAEKYSRVPGSALRGIHEWLADNERMLGLPAHWRVAIQAHTHQLGMFPFASNRLLVECGCLCQTPGYALGARVAGRPQRRGYVTFDLVDECCDVNSVRLHWLDGLEAYAS